MDPRTKMGYGIYLSEVASDNYELFEDTEEMKRALAAAFGLKDWGDVPDTCPVEFFEREVGDMEYALFIRSTVISWDWNSNGTPIDLMGFVPPSNAREILKKALVAMKLDLELLDKACVFAINYNS